jgi:hypothetical protein
MGRQPDAGRLRAALHRQKRPPLVRAARRQHGVGLNLFPGAGGDRRHHHRRLWVHQQRGGDPGGEFADLRDQPADMLLRRTRRRRYRPAHARGGVRLYRLDHHIADLRELHVHLLRHRGGDRGVDAGIVLRHSLVAWIHLHRRGGGAVGDAWHHADQPVPALDAAGVAGAERDRAGRRGGGASGLDRGLDALRGHRRDRDGKFQSDLFRRRRVHPAGADHADRRAGRLSALHAAARHWAAQRVVGGAAGGRAGLDRVRRVQAAGGIVPGLWRCARRWRR